MKFAESWPVLERAVKTAADAGNDALHLQALTNLALSYLRGVKPKLARKTGKIMCNDFDMITFWTGVHDLPLPTPSRAVWQDFRATQSIA